MSYIGDLINNTQPTNSNFAASQMGGLIKQFQPKAPANPTQLPTQLNPTFQSLQDFGTAAAHIVSAPGSELLTPALKKVGVPSGIALAAGTVGDFATPGLEGKAQRAASVVSYITKTGEKVFTHITPEELNVLKNEVKYIPQAAKGESQIHLDPFNSRLQEVAKELPRNQFINGHSQAAQVFKNASPKVTYLRQNGKYAGSKSLNGVDKALEPLTQEAKKYKSAEEFVNTTKYEDVQRAAFGVIQGDKITLSPKQLTVKYKEDYQNALENVAAPKTDKRTNGPIDVSLTFENGKLTYNIEDGYHRYIEALKTGKPVEVKIESIDANPTEVLGDKDYTKFLTDFYNKVIGKKK